MGLFFGRGYAQIVSGSYFVFADLPRHEGVIRKYEALSKGIEEQGRKAVLITQPHTFIGACSLISKVAFLRGGIWVRFSPFFGALLPALFLRKISGSKILTELPSPLALPKLRNQVFSSFCFSLVTWGISRISLFLATFVTDLRVEYAPSNLLEDKWLFNSKALVQLSNWADFSLINVAAPSLPSPLLKMIFVANVSVQHGIDRVLRGMVVYPNSALTIVGTGDELQAIKQLSIDLGVDKRVEFLGALRGTALDDAFIEQHVALSVFGFHRLGIDEGSPLKTREYAARGFPVVGAYRDTAIPDGSDFPFLRVPAGEDPIDLAEVSEFALKHQDREAVRRAGEKLFDIRYVIDKVL